MNKDKAMAWVRALRSGEYKQGISYLRIDCYDADDEFSGRVHCCLGVLAEISGFDEIHGFEVIDESMQESCNLRSEDGENVAGNKIVINNTKYGSLASANDSGVPFSEIADYIEKNYEDL